MIYFLKNLQSSGTNKYYKCQKLEDQLILGAGERQSIWKSTEKTRKFCWTWTFEAIYTICLLTDESETHLSNKQS